MASTLTINLKANDNASAPIGNVRSKLGGIVGTAGKALAGLTALGGAAVLGAAAAGVAAYGNFDKVITEINARTGNTPDQMAKIESAALKMGKETSFSASQAAQALLELQTSGDNAEEAIGRVPHVLNLAAAGGLGLGETADIVTDAMAAFGLEIKDTEGVANSMAAAAASSSADIRALGDGFKNAAPQANAMGMSLNDTAAALAIVNENGIKGAEAGTALKSMLNNMVRPTEAVDGAWNELGTSFYDAAGNARPLDDVIKDINVGLADKSPEEANEILTALFGTYGKGAALALLNADGIETMVEKMAEAPAAAETAKTQLESLEGVTGMLGSSLETLGIQVMGPFVENFLKPLIKEATNVVNAFAEWLDSDDVKTFIENAKATINDFLAFIQPAIDTVKNAFANIFGGEKQTVEASVGLMAGMEGEELGGGASGIETFIAGMEEKIQGFLDWLSPIIETVKGYWDDAFAILTDTILPALQTAFQPIQDALGELFAALSGEGGGVGGDQGEGLQEGLIGAIQTIKDVALPILQTFADAVALIFGGIGETVTGLITILQGALTGDMSVVLQGALKIINAFIKLGVNLFKLFAKTGLKLVKGLVVGILTSIGPALNKVGEAFHNVFSGIRKVVAGVINAIISAVETMINGILNIIADFIQPIIDFLRGLPFGAGASAAEGLASAQASLRTGVSFGRVEVADTPYTPIDFAGNAANFFDSAIAAIDSIQAPQININITQEFDGQDFRNTIETVTQNGINRGTITPF